MARTLIEAWAERFVADLKPRGAFRAAGLAVLEAHRSAGDRLVLLSASPDLYVPLIGRLLGFERTVCTEIRWNGDRLDGALRTPNRHGAEKVRCLEQLRVDYAHAAGDGLRQQPLGHSPSGARRARAARQRQRGGAPRRRARRYSDRRMALRGALQAPR